MSTLSRMTWTSQLPAGLRSFGAGARKAPYAGAGRLLGRRPARDQASGYDVMSTLSRMT